MKIDIEKELNEIEAKAKNILENIKTVPNTDPNVELEKFFQLVEETKKILNKID